MTVPSAYTPRNSGISNADDLETTSDKSDSIREAAKTARAMAEEGHTKEEIRAELHQNLSLQGAVITVVVAGATAYAGLNVMNSIQESMSLTQNDTFYNASNELTGGITDFFTNMPTVFVVIALVLIIGYLTLLR